MNSVESLAKASKELMLKEPFYGLLLMSLNKTWSKQIPTACVGLQGINYHLIINPDFWDSLTPLQKIGVLKHELLHIGFFHLVNYEKYKDKERLNMAMDIEINQYIERSWLPKEGCFIENFSHLNLEPKKGTVYYYEKLQEDKSACMKAIQDALDKGESSCELPNGQKVHFPDHDWEIVEKLDEATKKLIEAQTGHIIKQVADQVKKSRGTVPGEFEEIIKKLEEVDPPKFDWKGYMRRFAGKSVRTYTKKSKRKYNKRIPDNPGMKLLRHKHILVGIDTSASVSTNELKEFLNEIYHMSKTGSDVTIVQCDTAISHIGKFDHRKDLEIHGRGGTRFQPVINYYNENQPKFSCLFYLTDGEAPSPENATGNILWVLSSKSSMNESLPGSVIKLDI